MERLKRPLRTGRGESRHVQFDMTRTAVALVLLAGAIPLAAQPARNSTPDFSGTWVERLDATARPGRTPTTFTITQTPFELTIEGLGQPLVYNLTGLETTVYPTNATATSTARTRWDGPALVVEIVRVLQKASGRTVYRFTDTFRLDAANQLLYERRTVFERGDPQTVTVRYRRAM